MPATEQYLAEAPENARHVRSFPAVSRICDSIYTSDLGR